MEKLIGERISTFIQKDYTSIVIFPKRTRWKEAILFAWVIGFTIIGFYMIYLLLGGLDSIDNSGLEGDSSEILRNQKIYVGVFVGFWTYFEYKVVKGLMWVMFGKELIKAQRKGTIKIGKKWPGAGTREAMEKHSKYHKRVKNKLSK